MNRIIIVGNGFDLAHGLKTKYEDFINWYWEKTWKYLQNYVAIVFDDGLCYIESEPNSYAIYNYFRNSILSSEICNYVVSLKKNFNHIKRVDVSPLLVRISKSIETKGWVDIEADYYRMLVDCKGKKDELEKLNKDFAIIQRLLIEYLLSVQLADIDKSYFKLISAYLFAPFQAKDISVKANDKWNDFLKKRFGDSDLIDNIKLYIPFDAKERVKRVHEF